MGNTNSRYDIDKTYQMNFRGSTIKVFIEGLLLYYKYLEKWVTEGNETINEHYKSIGREIAWLREKLKTEYEDDYDIEVIEISGKALSIIKSSLVYLLHEKENEKKAKISKSMPEGGLEYLDKKISSIMAILKLPFMQEIPEESIMGEMEESSIPVVESLENILKRDESQQLEFKSSLSWDYKLLEANKGLEVVIAKTISAFLNSLGGILVIGVSDEKEILGLTNDYNLLSKKNKRDAFQLKVLNLINNNLGKEFHPYIHIDFEVIAEQDVCIVRMGKSNTPVYFLGQEFYVRANASTQKLDLKQTVEYIRNHWRES